jgi:hypothetical protein
LIVRHRVKRAYFCGLYGVNPKPHLLVERANTFGEEIAQRVEQSNPKSEPKHAPNKAQEAPSKDFDKQATNTRLATLNTATEILKTHRKPLELADVLSLASQLETWALDMKYQPLSNR